jgi:hypothetical protein
MIPTWPELSLTCARAEKHLGHDSASVCGAPTHGQAPAFGRIKEKQDTAMNEILKRYVIERDLPGIGKMNRDEFRKIAATSCGALEKLYGKIQWVHSYVADEKSFCIYLADGEASIREHARLSGFPANKITEAPIVIDPMTAFS